MVFIVVLIHLISNDIKHHLHMFICYLYIFFGEGIIQVFFLLFKKWAFYWFFKTSYEKFSDICESRRTCTVNSLSSTIATIRYWIYFICGFSLLLLAGYLWMFKMYLLEKEWERERAPICWFFWNALNSQGGWRLKQGNRSSIQVSPVGDRSPVTWAITPSLPPMCILAGSKTGSRVART